MRFQKPTCQPRLRGSMRHQLCCVSSMKIREEAMKQQEPSTCHSSHCIIGTQATYVVHEPGREQGTGGSCAT